MHTKQPRDQRSARKSVPLLLIACEGGAAEEAERKTNIAKYDRHQDVQGLFAWFDMANDETQTPFAAS